MLPSAELGIKPLIQLPPPGFRPAQLPVLLRFLPRLSSVMHYYLEVEAESPKLLWAWHLITAMAKLTRVLPVWLP